jgi:hypothetical protein
MTSCFDRCAILRRHGYGSMDDREYLANAIAHFRGDRHDSCSGAKLADDSLRAIDPVGSSFREMAVKTEYPRLDYTGMQQFSPHKQNTKSLTHSLPDTDYYQELFEHACRGRLKHVKTSLQALKEKSLPVPLQPLATLAADRGFPDILNFCLSQGAVFDPDLDMAALYATKTPGMLDVLMAQNWRNIAFSESARKETGCVPGSKSPQRPPMPTLPGGYATTLTPEQIEERFGDINW